MTQVQCTYCNARLGIKTRIAGKPIICGKCHRSFFIYDEPPQDAPFDDLPPMRLLDRHAQSGWAWSAGAGVFGLCALVSFVSTLFIVYLAIMTKTHDPAILTVMSCLSLGFAALGMIWGTVSIFKEGHALSMSTLIVNGILFLIVGGMLLFVVTSARIARHIN